MVPNGWEEKSLTEAGMTVTDGDRGKEYPNSSELYEEGYCLFLSAKNVTKKGFLFEETQFISKDKHEKLRKGTVKRGDIILTTRGTVGQTALYDESIKYDVIRINSGMATIGCNKSEVLSTFFYAYTNSSLFKRQIESFTFGSAQPQLTLKIIKSLKVPIPPLPEQQKIAQILTTWDKAIDTTARLIDNSKQQKKALMQQLLTGKKRLLDDEGKRFEGEWTKTPLINTVASNKYSFTGGPFGSDLKLSDYTETGVRIIQLQNIGDGHFRNDYKIFTSEEKADELLSCNIYPNDIIISKMGDPVARATLIPDFDTRYIMASDGIRLAVDKTKFDNKFILESINAPYFRSIALSKSTGSTRKRIGLTDLKNIPIFCPYLKEQQKIAAVLTNADKEIELLEQQLADLQQEKKALMQQLLTGKKRVVVDEIV